jgi:predicted GTPase
MSSSNVNNAPISLEEVMNNNFDIICRMKKYVEYAKGDMNLLNQFIDKAIERAKSRIYSRREV